MGILSVTWQLTWSQPDLQYNCGGGRKMNVEDDVGLVGAPLLRSPIASPNIGGRSRTTPSPPSASCCLPSSKAAVSITRLIADFFVVCISAILFINWNSSVNLSSLNWMIFWLDFHSSHSLFLLVILDQLRRVQPWMLQLLKCISIYGNFYLKMADE